MNFQNVFTLNALSSGNFPSRAPKTWSSLIKVSISNYTQYVRALNKALPSGTLCFGWHTERTISPLCLICSSASYQPINLQIFHHRPNFEHRK